MKPRKKYALLGILAAFLLTLAEHIAATYITHAYILPLAHEPLKLLAIASFVFALIGWYLGAEVHSSDVPPSEANISKNPDVRVTRLGALCSKVHVLGHNGTAKIRDLFSFGSETVIRGPTSGNREPSEPDRKGHSKGEQ